MSLFDTTDDTGTDSDRAASRTCCANCGDPIDTGEWHPVRTRTIDGTLRLFAFCDEACKDEWTRD